MPDLSFSLSSRGAFSYRWNKAIDSHSSYFVMFRDSIKAFFTALFCGYVVYESDVSKTEIIRIHNDSFFGKEYEKLKDMKVKSYKQECWNAQKHASKEEGVSGKVSEVKFLVEELEYLMMSEKFEDSNPNFSEENLKLLNQKDCCWLLHRACALDRTGVALRLLLTKKCDQLTHFLMLEKETILSFFARHNVLLGVKYLLEKDNINIVNSPDRNGNTALIAAAKEGSTESLKMLLKAGAKCNVVNSKGFAPLHYAALGGHVECVKELLGEKDIVVNVKNKYGYTPLYYGADGGYKACVKVLLSVDCGKGLLCLAVQKGHFVCFKTLLSENTMNVNEHDKFGNAPIHCAIEEGNVEGLILLLSIEGINVNEKNVFGMTPLHWAIENQSVACAMVLLNKKDVQFNVTDKDGTTLLHSAAEMDNTECLSALLGKAGIQGNMADKGGDTPFHCAIRMGNVKGVRLLVSAKDVNVFVNVANPLSGDTPLHLAAQRGSNTCLNVLLTAPAIDVNIANKRGNTALHNAARWGNVGCLKRLLSVPEIKYNVKNNQGLTPLQCAEASVKESYYAHKKCIEILREKLSL